MTPSAKRMTVIDGIAEANDWAELGRRVRAAAVEAAALRIDPSSIMDSRRPAPRADTYHESSKP